MKENITNDLLIPDRNTCLYCGKVLGIAEYHNECMQSLKRIWDERVKKGLCLECEKPLTKEDKEFDTDIRKHCKHCLIQKRRTCEILFKRIKRDKGELKI